MCWTWCTFLKVFLVVFRIFKFLVVFRVFLKAFFVFVFFFLGGWMAFVIVSLLFGLSRFGFFSFSCFMGFFYWSDDVTFFKVVFEWCSNGCFSWFSSALCHGFMVIPRDPIRFLGNLWFVVFSGFVIFLKDG